MLNGLKQTEFYFSPKNPTSFVGIVIGTLLLAFLIFIPSIPQSVSLKEGEIANTTIVSPREIEFESASDKQRTLQLIKQRQELVEDVYTIDESIDAVVKDNVRSIFERVKTLRDSGDRRIDLSELKKELDFLSPLQKEYLLYEAPLSSLEYIVFQSLEAELKQGYRQLDLKKVKSDINSNIQILDLDPLMQAVIVALISHYIQPNMVFNEAETQSKIQKEMASIVPFKTKMHEGQPLIYRGERVTASHIEMLKALNIYGRKANFFKFCGIFLAGFLGYLLFDRFVYYFNNRIYKNFKYFILIYMVGFVILTFALLIHSLHFSSFPLSFTDLAFFIPISFASMTLSILVTPNISLLIGSIFSLFIALMYQGDYYLFFYLFLANSAGTFATYKRYKRTQLIFSGYVVGLFNMVFVIAIGLLKEVGDLWWFAVNMFGGFLNGVVSSMISLALLPYLESVFKISTQQSLLEFSNLNHPLLKRLLLEAPGTYQHSIMVANLAETAAEAIGADPILSRVGAYFHDIGKLKRPLFFTENQGHMGHNPHDSISPRMSKIIISSHVKDGLELAAKHKLPDAIKTFIAEHHGTTLVSFFYAQAVQHEAEFDGAPEPLEEEFRYAGPKPSTKESAIVMMADSCEAAAKSLAKPTPTKIEALIDKIIQAKIEDEQFEECPISFREIQIIKATFVKVFLGIYHTRINYKEEIEAIEAQIKEKE